MNNVVLMGRLTKDPDIRYSGDVCIARYTLAINRRFNKEETDYISCVAFRGNAEFAEKYLKKGTKICVRGWIQTGSYTKDGKKHYTTDVIIEEQEFAESKGESKQESKPEQQPDFVYVPDNEPLPFN